MIDKLKVIFLDIDGVHLTGKCHLLDVNVNKRKEIFGNVDEKIGKSIYNAKVEYCLKSEFDKYSIMLVNRLVEKTGAKIVIHSNWRRSVGNEASKEKLIEQGIKEENFHEDYYCEKRMTSEKISDITSWLHGHRTTKQPKMPSHPESYMMPYDERKNDKEKKKVFDAERKQHEEEMKIFNEKSNDFGIEYVIIDDENIDSYGKNSRQVRTDFDEGFTLEEYRIACAILQAEDIELDVCKLSESEFTAVETEFIRKDALYEWLYSKKANEGYTCPRATLLSFEAAKKIATDPISRFYGGGIESVDDLYSTRSKNIWLELKSKYSNKKKHPLIIDGYKSLEEVSGVKASLWEDNPKGFPCVFIGTKENPEYLYAPDNVENDEDFLYGYLLSQEKNKKD